MASQRRGDSSAAAGGRSSAGLVPAPGREWGPTTRPLDEPALASPASFACKLSAELVHRLVGAAMALESNLGPCKGALEPLCIVAATAGSGPWPRGRGALADLVGCPSAMGGRAGMRCVLAGVVGRRAPIRAWAGRRSGPSPPTEGRRPPWAMGARPGAISREVDAASRAKAPSFPHRTSTPLAG